MLREFAAVRQSVSVLKCVLADGRRRNHGHDAMDFTAAFNARTAQSIRTHRRAVEDLDRMLAGVAIEDDLLAARQQEASLLHLDSLNESHNSIDEDALGNNDQLSHFGLSYSPLISKFFAHRPLSGGSKSKSARYGSEGSGAALDLDGPSTFRRLVSTNSPGDVHDMLSAAVNEEAFELADSCVRVQQALTQSDALQASGGMTRGSDTSNDRGSGGSSSSSRIVARQQREAAEHARRRISRAQQAIVQLQAVEAHAQARHEAQRRELDQLQRNVVRMRSVHDQLAQENRELQARRDGAEVENLSLIHI